MNQILSTKLNDNIPDNNKKIDIDTKILKKSSNKNFFKFQFGLSIFLIIIFIMFSVYYYYSIRNKEKLSKNLIGNYNIYKLYSSVNNQEKETENNIFGIIEIPKLSLYYPVFSNLTEENLKVSPCKFYGGSLNENTNICIAGHNYNNDMFFSKINYLQENDEIYIYDNTGIRYTYIVSNNYEVKADDLSPIFNYSQYEKILTLITCNNFNNNRFVIKAKRTS